MYSVERKKYQSGTQGYKAPFLYPLAENLGDILAGYLPTQGQQLPQGIFPQVAAVNPFIQAAQQRTAQQAGLGALQFDPNTGEVVSIGPGTGIAAYEPFLASAEQLLEPGSQYQQYMSPYQQEVIDATQKLLQEQREAGRSRLAANAIQQGAFGSGREGVARAEYERERDIYDANLLAGLRQQGLQQALNLQQTALGNISAFPTLQSQLQRGITSELGTTGAGAQQFSQNILDVGQQGEFFKLNYPFQQLQQATNIFGGLAGYSPGVLTQPMVTSPGLTAAQTFAGIYGGMIPRQDVSRNLFSPLAGVYMGNRDNAANGGLMSLLKR